MVDAASVLTVLALSLDEMDGAKGFGTVEAGKGVDVFEVLMSSSEWWSPLRPLNLRISRRDRLHCHIKRSSAYDRR